mgnify:CR=1 FL=1
MRSHPSDCSRVHPAHLNDYLGELDFSCPPRAQSRFREVFRAEFYLEVRSPAPRAAAGRLTPISFRAVLVITGPVHLLKIKKALALFPPSQPETQAESL